MLHGSVKHMKNEDFEKTDVLSTKKYYIVQHHGDTDYLGSADAG